MFGRDDERPASHEENLLQEKHMSIAVKPALIAAVVALGFAMSTQAQSYSSPIHHYRHRRPVQRNSEAGIYQRELYNYSLPSKRDPGYPASDTADGLDE